MGRFQISLLFVVACLCSASFGFTCKQAERNALLKFKHSFIDQCNVLSSWVGQDCCSSWQGVGCHNVTGNVIKLDLGGYSSCLQAGEVNPSLLELKYLSYLDLSYVDFNQSTFPEFFGSMRQLQHLDLSRSSFSGKVPSVLGNLTQLVFLDLNQACYQCEMERNDIEWASKLVNLKYLGLGGIDLSQALDTLNILYKLPSLLNLTLFDCQLGNSHRVLTNSTVSSPILHHLDLSFNLFSGSIPHFIHNLSSIRFLDLSLNHLNSSIPSWLADKTYLEYLLLSYNNINRVDRGVVSIISRHCRLKHLDLSNNQLQEEVSKLHVYNFSKCSRYDLEVLDMSNNKISGYLPIIGSLSSLLELHLSYNHLENIPPSLEGLSSLSYLGLSNNNLTIVPTVIGSLSSLEMLDLSSNNFENFPLSLEGLSSLSYLDLSNNKLTVLPKVIGSVSSLQTLYLSDNNLENLPSSLEGLSSLQELYLSHNNLKNFPPSLEGLSSLQELDLSYNNLENFPPSLEGLSSLVQLYLSHNSLEKFPSSLGDLSSLQELHLSYNNLENFPPSLEGLSSLQELYLSHNNLEKIPSSLGDLSSLQELHLSYNNSTVVPISIGSLLSLLSLGLSHNNLETLPSSLGGLSSLVSLDLSYNNLSVVHQASFANLSSLTDLDMSSNPNLHFSPDWMPPFQLESLNILPCKLNSPFPKWLLSQKRISKLDLSDTGIFGPLPETIGTAMSSLKSLSLANNHINGSIPRSLCGLSGLNALHLQNNRLSGTIPDCWSKSQIADMVLSSNMLSGPIPNSLTKASDLQLLRLNNNSIEGKLPFSWSSSPYVELLDVSQNKLHGEIPPWDGSTFGYLQILILRENNLEGKIPLQLCSVQTLSIINLANNNLVGPIPRCFGHFRAMGSMLHSSVSTAPETTFAQPPKPSSWSAQEVVKGQDREYTTVLDKLVNMDLSCNHFVGAIPTEITSLSILDNLNLSHNHLFGIIPVEIGKMKALESLDLSSNNLSGSIPESLPSLDSLSILNLSFNNLQGKIPTGRHFQTLEDPSIYMNNPGLCGDPLPKKCFGDDNGVHPPTVMVVLGDEGDNRHEKMWFYLIIMLGFAITFWGVIGILIAHKKWRIAYFRIAEELADWIYVKVEVRIARANRGTRGV